MKANATPLVALFEKKMRLEVPLFQRQYVWNAEQQWQPLWEDIQRKFSEYLEGRLDAPVHFLGAIVLDQKQTPTTHVERRLVIDGQQRLTTLQIFLVAFRDYCVSIEANELADECRNFTLNKGMMPDPEVDKYKVWPTQLDRDAFRSVMGCGSPEALLTAYPLVYKKYARKPNPRPRIVEAYLFFYNQIAEFFEGRPNDEPLAFDVPIIDRLEQCFQALRNALLVVVIDLEEGDDAQVIFETLNARGAPLLPADLLRNYIFLRAARHGEDQETLYPKYWAEFDKDFWREEVSQGRINRPRSDLFMQHFLASQQGADIPVKHLYVEYRHWIEKTKPFQSVENELQALASYRESFARLLEVETGHPYSSLAEFLAVYDIGTAYPLMLLLLDSALESEEMREICVALESYLARRAVCRLTNQNLNRVFINLTRNLRKDGVSARSVLSYLRELRGESAEWPDNERFYSAWMSSDLYRQLNNARLTYLLRRLDALYRGAKSETVVVEGPLTVEHILPQNWVDNWPLLDGAKGLTSEELWDAPEDDLATIASRQRNQAIHTIGNLTIMTQGLNSSVSNSAWSQKKPELLKFSLLPINQELHELEGWDEKAIAERGARLFEKALQIWPKPE